MYSERDHAISISAIVLLQTNAAPSKKEIAIQRAAAGSKSITSFFKKK